MRLLALFPERLNPKGIAEIVAGALGADWTVTGAAAPADEPEALASADAMLVELPEDVGSELRLTRVELRELLEQSDVISVHVPLFESTRGLIGADEIKLMKQHAILVNTSRGPVVDNAAVADAANEGRIIAGIDVFDPEPPGPDHPLRSASNVVLSPHVAGTTR